MNSFIERSDRFMAIRLDLRSRGLLVVAAVLLVAVFLFPLWTLTMFAPQYPDGLRMNIYSYKLDGGNGVQDIKEINVLNHYIGMSHYFALDGAGKLDPARTFNAAALAWHPARGDLTLMRFPPTASFCDCMRVV